MQCSCKPFVILILAIYQKSLGFSSKCWVFCCSVHSKLGQDKCAKTVKVDVSSSYLTPVLFRECHDTEKPILSFLQKAYVYCICMSVRALHMPLVLCLGSVTGKLAWSLAKWYWYCRPGVANHPQMSWDTVFWLDGGGDQESPHSHSVFICVHLWLSLALSVILKSDLINNIKAPPLSECTEYIYSLWCKKHIVAA